MNLQKTTQYAIKVLSQMALQGKESLSADALSESTGIPKRYLRRLMTELSKGGFLKVVRGRNGGFSFARELSGISLFDIITFFESDSFRDRCILGFTFCVVDKPCVMHDQWLTAQEETISVLKSTTLESLRETYFKKLNTKTKYY